MNRLFFIIFFLLFSLSSFCQKDDVSAKSIREIFSAYKNMPEPSENYSIFWQFIQNNNKSYNKYLNSNSKPARQTRYDYKKIITSLNVQTASMLDKDNELAKLFCGENYSKYIKGIVFDPYNETENAYAFPNGLVYIANGLEKMINTEKSITGMIGIIAHEIAHCVLNHAEVYSYSLKIKERNNNIKKTIAQSLAGVAVLASEMAHVNAGITYTQENGEQYSALLENSLFALEQAFDNNSYKYKFSYSREQEIEADIVACLYLIWIGENPNHYLDVLRTFRKNSVEYIQSNDNTHPSINFRINLLKEYFLEAELYVDTDGEVMAVPKYQKQKFKDSYPKAKKVKKEVFKKFNSENVVFLYNGKHYIVPTSKISHFLQISANPQVINLTR